MATITLTSTFNTDNFWAARSGEPLIQTATTYEFINSVGRYVVVTGTLTYAGENPSTGTYTSIEVFADDAHTQTVASYSSTTDVDFATYFTAFATNALGGDDTIIGSTGNDTINGYGGGDTITGSGGNDTINGGAGSDTLDGGEGNDRYAYTAAEAVTGEINDTGSVGTDQLLVLANTDFTSESAFLIAAFVTVEGVGFSGANQTVTFDAAQLPGDFAVIGANGAQHVVVNNASSFDGSGWTFGGGAFPWNTLVDTITINGTSGADNIIGTSSDDIINGFGDDDRIRGSYGADLVDGGDGSDTYDFISIEVSNEAGEHVNDTGDEVGDVDTVNLLNEIAPGDSVPERQYAFLQIDAFDGIEDLTFNYHAFINLRDNLPADLVINGMDGMRTELRIVGVTSFDGSEWTFHDWIEAEPEADAVLIMTSTLSSTIIGTDVGDTVFSFEGDDVVTGGLGDDDIKDLSGIDTAIFSGDFADYVIVVDQADGSLTVTGPDGNDEVAGFNFLQFDDMTIEAPGITYTGTTGDDTVEGFDGTDSLSGGEGNDELSGGYGTDELDGGDGTDDLDGGDGNDTIDGGNGNDTIDGGAGADTMDGGEGSDTYVVDDAGDEVTDDPPSIAAMAPGALPPADIDTVRSSINYTLGDDIENLVLLAGALIGTGNGGANIITGNDGANTLDGKGGADALIGLDGNDTFLVDNAGDNITETAGQGTADRARATVSFTLGTGDNVELLEAANAALTSTLNLTGNEIINAITGNAGTNTLKGMAGNDGLKGLAGNDTLDGGVGNDRLEGGTGNDTYVIDSASDLLIDTAGTDTVRSTVAKTLATGFENLVLISGNIGGTGNTVGNAITGSSGKNTLKGLGGNDTLNGGSGNDKLYGGLGNDKLAGGANSDAFVFNTKLNAKTNKDTITDFNVAADVIHLENAIFKAIKGVGKLTEKQFFKGAAAHDADDRIVYNSKTGALIYDANGDAAGGAVQFGILTKSPDTVTHADFFII